METKNNQIYDSKILIVDDHEANVMLLTRMLKMHQFTNIISTTDAREVMYLYLDEKPELILLDLKMPYLDGFEVLRVLNRMKGEDFLAVIMITAQDDHANKMQALELGVREFLGKPFDQAEVITRIINILEVKLLHNSVREQNRLLEMKVEERTAQLLDMQLELIQRLLKAAEFRDHSTGHHILRIGYFSRELGKLVGLSDSRCEKLMHASMMHDIGKVGIPDAILLNENKLSDDEWVVMKQHTVKGANILSNSTSEMIQLAESIALTHHEKWDGTGYPNGLKGEEIPMESRITTICDVFDALLSKRPYKQAWSMEAVVNEIKHISGSYLDPSLTQLFLEHIQLFIAIRNEYEE